MFHIYIKSIIFSKSILEKKQGFTKEQSIDFYIVSKMEKNLNLNFILKSIKLLLKRNMMLVFRILALYTIYRHIHETQS